LKRYEEQTTDSGCKGYFRDVVEKNGTQEKRFRSGSYVYVRRGEAKPVTIAGIEREVEYWEVVLAPRHIIRTWQLQRTARYYVIECPGVPPERKLRQSKEPVWIQLADEEVAGEPVEVLAVFTGPKPITGKDNQEKATDYATNYEKAHPDGVTYNPALDGKPADTKGK
jgi:hypothetical protein